METSVHAVRAHARIEHMIFRLENILIPQVPSAREKERLTSVTKWSARVWIIHNVVSWKVDAMPVMKVKNAIIKLRYTIRSNTFSTETKAVIGKAKPTQGRNATYTLDTWRKESTVSTRTLPGYDASMQQA